MTTRPPQIRRGAIGFGGALVGIGLALGGCQHDEAVTASIPDSYKQRHPIAIEEQNRSIVVFAGHARGGLTAGQRADRVRLATASPPCGAWLPPLLDTPGTPQPRPGTELMAGNQAKTAGR